MEKLLITGATGHLGRSVVEHLLQSTTPANIAVFARDDKKADYFKSKGIDIRIGDYDDVHSIEKAFEGIGKVLLISGTDPFTRFQQHLNVVNAAQASGVKHIVYTGVSIADLDTSANKFLMQSHFQTEDYIIRSELGYTFLRNNLYADIIPMFSGDKVFDTGITLPTENGKVAFALRREIGEAAANVLLQDGHENKIYEITGSAAHSFSDVALELTSLSGREISYNPVNSAAYSKHLQQFGVPDNFIQVLSAFSEDIKNNLHARTTGDLETLLGRKPASLSDALKELYGL